MRTDVMQGDGFSRFGPIKQDRLAEDAAGEQRLAELARLSADIPRVLDEAVNETVKAVGFGRRIGRDRIRASSRAAVSRQSLRRSRSCLPRADNAGGVTALSWQRARARASC
jgi:hypothetical protein